jgi:predicted nucleic acid-binding protein
VIAIDTSVAVPALSTGHPDHETARAVVAAEKPWLPIHAAVETYAVLTRLPPPAGVPPAVAAEVLNRNFGQRTIGLAEGDVVALFSELAAAGVAGGATYDALVGATARSAAATLVTSDRRAAGTYAQLGVTVRFLDGGASSA